MGGCVGGLAGRADGGAGPIPLAPRDARPPRAGGARPGGARYGGPGPSGSGGRKGPSAGRMGRTGSAPRSLAGGGVREPGCGSGADARPRSGTAGADGASEGPARLGFRSAGGGVGRCWQGLLRRASRRCCLSAGVLRRHGLGLAGDVRDGGRQALGVELGSRHGKRAAGRHCRLGAGAGRSRRALGACRSFRRRVRPLPAAGCGCGRQREIPRPRWQGSARWLVAVRQPRVVALDRHWRARRIGQARSPAPTRCGGGRCRSDPGLRIGPL